MTTVDNIVRANAALGITAHDNVEEGYSLRHDGATEAMLTREEALKAISMGIHVIAIGTESTLVLPIRTDAQLERYLENIQGEVAMSVDPAYGYGHIGESTINITEIKELVQSELIQEQTMSENTLPEEPFQQEAAAAENPESTKEPEQEPDQQEKTRIFVDMDGTLAEFQPVAVEALYETGYFENLQPNENVLAAVKSIIAEQPGLEVNILSSYLGDSPCALQEKNAWLDKHLPEIPAENRIFVPCGKEKKEHVPGGIRPIDVLLDDYSKNLHSWDPPGMGIKLMNGINGTRGTWQAASVSHELTPEQLSANIMQHVNENLQANELYGDKNLKNILSLLDKNGMDAEKEWMQELVGNYAALKKEVFSLQHDIAELKAQIPKARRGFRKAVKNVIAAGERDAGRFHTALDNAKETIKSTCSNCLKAVKAKGLSALRGTLDFLKVKKILTNIQDNCKETAGSYHDAAEKLGAVRTEIRGAGVQFANIGRVTAGKEREELTTEPKGKGVLHNVQQFLIGTEDRFSQMGNTVGKGIAHIENLESKTVPRKPLQERLAVAKQKADLRQTDNEESRAVPGKTVEAAI